MGKCFVIQPFDGGEFDKRYDDVLEPAIKAADLEPYRVDRDPAASIPILDVQSGIEWSRACLADITTDNPNVWFELGYAIAMRRDVVLICCSERKTRFPFDVQHRRIIEYSTEAPRDFEELQRQITRQLKAVLQKEAQLELVARISPVAAIEGLEQEEIAALTAVAQELDDPTASIAGHVVRQNIKSSGFNDLAATLGLRRLLDKQMVEILQDQDWNGNSFIAYRATDKGMKWLFQNKETLRLKAEPPKDPPGNDIPF